MNTIERILEQRIESKLKPNKVILIFGARRVGKTTLIRQIAKKFTGKTMILNGDDSDAVALLREKSISNYRNLLKGIDLLVIDEAQNIQEIGQKLKLIVDEMKNIRIIASGSSSFISNNEAGEPLVGRNYTFLLFPFSQQELSATENRLETRQNLEDRLIYGSYPEVVGMENGSEKSKYFFWWTYDGQEIDLIEKKENSLYAFELKWSEKKVRIPGAFLGTYPEASFLLVHKENYLQWLDC